MNGLVGWWKFDDGSGAAAVDSSGQSNAGTLVNAPTWTASGYRNGSGALSFASASSQRITIADSDSLNLTTSFSIACWIKRSTTGAFQMIYDSGTQANHWYVQIYNTDKLDFTERNIADNVANTVIDTNWHHIAVVKNGDAGVNVALYLDGNVDGAATVGTVALPSGQKLIAKWSDGTLYFNGSMDDLRIYNRAITATEANDLYLMGIGRVVYGKNSVVSNSKTSF